MLRRPIKILLLFFLLALPALALAQTPAATPDNPASTQAQITALQQAIKATNTATANAQMSGDNAWMLTSAALVLLMTGPGLALFYGGLVRKKNVLGTMMQSFAAMGLVSVIWAIVGYSLAFGHGNAFIGGFEHLFLRGVTLTPNTDYAATIPEQTFMIYQLMFAIITPALITGAFAERMKFSSMAIFLSLWSIFVYCPMAHMVWGVGGLLNATNAHAAFPSLDFAPHHQWRLGAGLLHLPGQTHRLPADQDAAALVGDQLHRRLPALGGLVRI
jgi:Amt family ammonium transporter